MEYTVYQLLWFFLAYSFLGWLGETALAAAKRRRLINRGFLNVPFSPVYGLAAVLFAIFLPELKNTPFFLFLFGLIIATGLELFTGILLEHLSGQKWWDYSRYRFQFEGHICLGYSLLWGGMALLCRTDSPLCRSAHPAGPVLSAGRRPAYLSGRPAPAQYQSEGAQ